MTPASRRAAVALAAALIFAQPPAGHTGEASTTSTISSFSSLLMDRTRDLSTRYRLFERAVRARGGLRSDPAAPGVPWTVKSLSRAFINIAMFSEYGGDGGFGGGRHAGVLRRWTRPVNMRIVFGASVPAEQRARDTRRIGDYAQALQGYTGHSVRLGGPGPANVHILVLSDAERRAVAPRLDEIVPGVGRAVAKAFAAAGPNILCFVAAEPDPRPERGYRRAVVLVRAEHPSRMRRSCIEEELAQAMGLPNDAKGARPSIFNDDEEFGVLTRHDQALLRMLYDPLLAPGMTTAQVVARLGEVAARAMRVSGK